MFDSTRRITDRWWKVEFDMSLCWHRFFVMRVLQNLGQRSVAVELPLCGNVPVSLQSVTHFFRAGG